ncbi:hypothetical protein evm_008366 [Chilo suppressalis]|nr:hypothetical protein evm_008366 [Chilo suppressalis]
MSIYFDFEVGASGRRFRKAVDGDIFDISLFLDSDYDKLFGTPDIGRLIELSTLSICMINAAKEVVGFLALDDHPNIPSVDPADWETWIRNMFQRYYISRNTLFVHYICCMESVRDYFLDEALVTVFENDMYLKQILLVVPPQCPEELILRHPVMKKKNVYKHHATYREDFDTGDRYIYTFSRNEFCPRLRMRRAVEEDNDDIIEILDKTCPRLRDLYGDYFISELIGRHPESRRKIIVAEHQDRAVAVMCLNEDVNYTKLESTYQLRPYYGLRKATALEKERAKRANNLMMTFGLPILAGKWSPFQHINKYESFLKDQESEENLRTRSSKQSSKVNFGKHAMRKSFDHIIYRSQLQYQSDDYSEKIYPFSPSQSRNTAYSVTDLLEADPFDYEIVNIDYDLFNIPEVSSHSMNDNKSLMRQQKLNEIKKRRCSQSIPKNQHKSEDSDIYDYSGEPNAFIIELLGLRDGYSSRHMFDLLEAAFEVMKIYDYCIIRIPCEEQTLPLLQHFSYVPTKRSVCSKYALYIAHRASVFGKLRVKEAELVDVPNIATLLNNLEGKETLWTIENCIHARDQHKAYVLLSGLTVVGVGILE